MINPVKNFFWPLYNFSCGTGLIIYW